MLKHRGFRGRKQGFICFQVAPPSQQDLSAKQVLNKDSQIDGVEDSVKASKASVKEVVSLASKRIVNSCTVPLGLASIQKFSVHIMRFRRLAYKNGFPGLAVERLTIIE